MVPCGHRAEALRKDAGVIRLVKAKKNSDPPSAAKRRRDLGDDDSLPVIVPRQCACANVGGPRKAAARASARSASYDEGFQVLRVAATAGARGFCGSRGADRLFSMHGLVLQERW
jgi:hypothetical protein